MLSVGPLLPFDDFMSILQLKNRKLVNTILYADDQILIATSEDELQIIGYHLNLISRKYKMTISSTKTKSMAVCGEPHTEGENCEKTSILLNR